MKRGTADRGARVEGVTWKAVECPSCHCRATERLPDSSLKCIHVVTSLGRVRFHECRACGVRFKSVEE